MHYSFFVERVAYLLCAIRSLDCSSLLLLLLLSSLSEDGVYTLPVLSSGITPLDVLVGGLVQMLQARICCQEQDMMGVYLAS